MREPVASRAVQNLRETSARNDTAWRRPRTTTDSPGLAAARAVMRIAWSASSRSRMAFTTSVSLRSPPEVKRGDHDCSFTRGWPGRVWRTQETGEAGARVARRPGCGTAPSYGRVSVTWLGSVSCHPTQRDGGDTVSAHFRPFQGETVRPGPLAPLRPRGGQGVTLQQPGNLTNDLARTALASGELRFCSRLLL
jgi:hypothetical protein